jgi:uncharacterized protein (UPF0335 family)
MIPAGTNTGSTVPIDDQSTHSFAKDQLKAIVERIERVEAEMKTLTDDRTEIYAEAKSNGYDCKALRAIIRERKQDSNKLAEFETILDTYKQALDMLVRS